MKKIKKTFLGLVLVLSVMLAACQKEGAFEDGYIPDDGTQTESAEDDAGTENSVESYPNSALEDFATFTSVTGIELNIKEDAPESNGVLYNYLLDYNASGLGAITKYEAYIREYGFKLSEELSSDESRVYLKDGIILITGEFVLESANALQYVVFIQNS